VKDLQKILKTRTKHRVELENFRPSAVLVPVFYKSGEEHLLFTVRNEKVRHHKGEVCFPGGAYDPPDKTLEKTALRECEEEIGIPEKTIEVIGEMDDLITPTFYRISPFVGILPYPYSLKINHREIAEVIEIPLSHFKEEKHLRLEYFEYFGENFEIPFYSWKNQTIWGATARIVRQLVELMRGRKEK
jgi:8-oxo-dGTP pyrophosphatase MutT (NUDIX family)